MHQVGRERSSSERFSGVLQMKLWNSKRRSQTPCKNGDGSILGQGSSSKL